MPRRKNWSVVRRLEGYAGYELHALLTLNCVHALARDYVNYVQPVRKLVEKTRDGAKVRKRHNRAAIPYQRLLASGVLDPDTAPASPINTPGLIPCRSSCSAMLPRPPLRSARPGQVRT